MDFEAPHLWVEYFLEELSLSNAEFHLSHCLFKSTWWRRGCLRKVTVCHLLPSELGTKREQGKTRSGTGRLAGDTAGCAAGKQQPRAGPPESKLQNTGQFMGKEGRVSL